MLVMNRRIFKTNVNKICLTVWVPKRDKCKIYAEDLIKANKSVDNVNQGGESCYRSCRKGG